MILISIGHPYLRVGRHKRPKKKQQACTQNLCCLVSHLCLLPSRSSIVPCSHRPKQKNLIKPSEYAPPPWPAMRRFQDHRPFCPPNQSSPPPPHPHHHNHHYNQQHYQPQSQRQTYLKILGVVIYNITKNLNLTYINQLYSVIYNL
jgi:hypothetical protein